MTTPNDYRQAAHVLDHEVFLATPLTAEQFEAADLSYLAMVRIARIIERLEDAGDDKDTLKLIEIATGDVDGELPGRSST